MPNESGRIKFYDAEKIKQINPETLRLWKKYESDMMLRELSPKTIEGYRNDCQHWFIYILDNQNNQCVTELNEEDVTDFLLFCKMEGNNSRRMKRRMSSISAFYKYLRKKKIISENPMEFIDRPKKDTDIVVQTYLTKEQIDDMRIKLKEKGDLTLETYIMFSLSTMARVNAVSNLTWKQIDLENRVCNDVREKEGYIVVLYFSEEVKELLSNLKKYREENKIDDGGYVFFSKREDKITPMTNGSLNDWCHRVGRMIGVDTLHCHDLRHSMATLYKNEGMSLEDVSLLLNHASTDVTKKHYIKADKSKISKSKDSFII
jgi:integrase/recombinase XerC